MTMAVPVEGAEPPAIRADRWAPLRETGRLIDQRVSKLQKGYLADRPSCVADLARLRRGVGMAPGSVGEVLHLTTAEEFARGATDDEPTPREWAAHIAFTLYAVHQQSVRKSMHRRGYGLGRSARLLRKHSDTPEPEDSPVTRRFRALGTAQSLEALVYQLRGLAQQLRAAEVPMDYGLLADQLVTWQGDGGGGRIRLNWGRDYYRLKSADDASNSDPTDSAPGAS